MPELLGESVLKKSVPAGEAVVRLESPSEVSLRNHSTRTGEEVEGGKVTPGVSVQRLEGPGTLTVATTMPALPTTGVGKTVSGNWRVVVPTALVSVRA